MAGRRPRARCGRQARRAVRGRRQDPAGTARAAGSVESHAIVSLTPVQVVRRWLLRIFILTFPLYVLPSGMPQPSSVSIVIGCVMSVAGLARMLRSPFRGALLSLLL